MLDLQTIYFLNQHKCLEGFSVCQRLHTLQAINFLYQHQSDREMDSYGRSDRAAEQPAGPDFLAPDENSKCSIFRKDTGISSPIRNHYTYDVFSRFAFLAPSMLTSSGFRFRKPPPQLSERSHGTEVLMTGLLGG